MNIIKIRGWDEETKTLYSPVDLSGPLHSYAWLGQKDLLLELFTGLRDKKKIEIYDGDILRKTGSIHGGNGNLGLNLPMQVMYVENYKWKLMNRNGSTFGLGIVMSNPNAFEIIGDIHLNPKYMHL